MNFKKLTLLGLSKQDIFIYKQLTERGAMPAVQLAEMAQTPASSLYRNLRRLEELGFIVCIRKYPQLFQAVPLQAAASAYIDYQQRIVFQLTGKHVSKKQQPSMELLTGREVIFEKYVQLTRQAHSELLTISIGEEVPEHLFETVARAMARGAKNYMIFHRHTKQNSMWLKRWRSLGSNVKILDNAGFHLNIIDGNYAILSASNPQQTAERTAILITSTLVVRELRSYFFLKWSQAKELSRPNELIS